MQSSPVLRGRTALITGATGGIGLACAEALAAEGCDILLHGLEEHGPALAADLAARFGIACRYHVADLADPAAIEALAAAAGEPDILVNNAVTRHFAPVEATSRADWDRDIAVNLSAAFHLISLSLPAMRRRDWGRIVNMSSIYGRIGTRGRIGYVTTKTALIGLTRGVALETAGTGITCNAICPGTTLTPNIAARIRAAAAASGRDEEAEARHFLGPRQPTGRFVEASAIGAMVAFLCGPAGRDITGAELPMDGGWSIA
ncbi:SDR family oxidoreductase [Siccirubricoccus sp. KC 17139]|uniref:SDR family oxidoreductase n=1 Tax=Siccirubricoccus soli TaxID=2899147 RepID=A0ABT1D6Z1_9PROT|nr:SDR family oxidoreductase [Siccirubricoccus soli]MCO6416760.1 SDR family oxidoreductase [Siccirubricoccus soli]MCP2682895.1 SDR family oxidoreductase [Siccirubricoccus soli]